MFPRKSSVDYNTTEMNRLFASIESHNAYGLAHSPYSNVNRSSSSADSTSPEVFPEITTFHSDNRPMPDTSKPFYRTPPKLFESRPMYDTPKASDAPFLGRRQRPIVGRKILSETSTPNNERVQPSPLTKIPDEDFLARMWQEDPILNQHTPPNVNYNFLNNTNVYYELFPSDNKGIEFKTLVKTPPTLSSNISNISPLSNISPTRSPLLGPTMYQQRSPSVASFSSSYRPESSRYHDQKICTFCRKNGETPIVFSTHSVKQKVGNKYIVSCPILRSHVCSTCGASGDNAHTITYCPVLRSGNNGQPLESTTITLKSTRVKSNGRRRY